METMTERFAIPCVGAIIEREVDGVPCILLQTRDKPGGGDTNGKLELPAGKLREYEGVYDALRREVWEETGLRVTEIDGEAQAVEIDVEGVRTVAFSSFCTTQNLCGAYSIVLHTFVCRAEGEPLPCTEETRDIGWVPRQTVCELLQQHPESFFFMHVCALKKYFSAV